MSLVEHKKMIYLDMKQKFGRDGAEVTVADSILMRHGDLITKVPMQRCAEEIFIINTFKKLGIPTVEITNTNSIQTRVGEVPAYTMKAIDGAVDLIRLGNKFLNADYYAFLTKVFEGLQSTSMDGFGAIQLTESEIQTEFSSDKELLGNVLQMVKKRQYWPKIEIDKLEDDLTEVESDHKAILAHTDILHNILVDTERNFYLIDPQTIVSAANRYWDLSYYLIYANGYGCTSGLVEFFRGQNIDDWNLFMLTTKINTYERTSFYTHYDSARVPGMLAFLENLKEGKVRIGNTVLTRNDL